MAAPVHLLRPAMNPREDGPFVGARGDTCEECGQRVRPLVDDWTTFPELATC